MLYLVASILCSAYLTLSFKVLQRLGISSFQAIVFNYWTCVVTGSLVGGSLPITGTADLQVQWLPWAIVMGTLFIVLFNVISYTARNIGVAVASVANKLSLVIPFSFSILLYNEVASMGQVLGILLAIVAVTLTCYPSGNTDTIRHRSRVLWLMPLVLFVGSGMLDSLIKYVEQGFLDASNNDRFLVTAFGCAALLGSCAILLKIGPGKEGFQPKAVVAGVMIGVPNYFSIWSLVNVLKQYPGRSGMIIPLNNIGIVLLSALAAFAFFRERLSAVNWVGILLSILAITLIAFA